VDSLLNDNIINTIEVPLVISNDNYIADGHHRWAAFRLEAPQKPIDVIVIDAPIKDVIGLAISWGATTQSF
jgi:ParB-like chromosome segregation protein Spo0J